MIDMEELKKGIIEIKKENFPLAIKKLLPLAKKGNGEAQYYVGYAYYEMRCGDDHESLVESITWYELSVNAGNPKAHIDLGLINLKLKNLKLAEDLLEKAFTIFFHLANGGDGEAQYWLTLIYLNGWGRSKNIEEALKWFNKASKCNDPDILFDCAMIAASSDYYGISLTTTMYHELILKAANGGSFRAQYAVGSHYESNEFGFFENKKEAAKWYELACQKEYASAQYCLGRMLLTGDGIEKDLVRGRELLVLSAESGDSNAIDRLAECYETGLFGFTKSSTKAKYWRGKGRGAGSNLDL